jgi:hypothetical protein
MFTSPVCRVCSTLLLVVLIVIAVSACGREASDSALSDDWAGWIYLEGSDLPVRARLSAEASLLDLPHLQRFGLPLTVSDPDAGTLVLEAVLGENGLRFEVTGSHADASARAVSVRRVVRRGFLAAPLGPSTRSWRSRTPRGVRGHVHFSFWPEGRGESARLERAPLSGSVERAAGHALRDDRFDVLCRWRRVRSDGGRRAGGVPGPGERVAATPLGRWAQRAGGGPVHAAGGARGCLPQSGSGAVRDGPSARGGWNASRDRGAGRERLDDAWDREE